jgi:hypothetical protein
LGRRLNQIIAWLDTNCGAEWVNLDPSTTRGVVNDALAVYFADAILASALVARWWAAQRTEIVDGVYRVRDGELRPQIGAALHRTPELEVKLTKFCIRLPIVLRRHARAKNRSRRLSTTMPTFDHIVPGPVELK